MFEVGEIKLAREIGKKGSNKYIFASCEGCNKQRWTVLRASGYHPRFCVPCTPRMKPKYTPEEVRIHSLISSRKTYALLKKEVMDYYSNGQRRCAVCHIDDLDVLCIDHINGGGKKHIEEIRKGGKGGTQFYRWLKSNGFPSGYQVLCSNCNLKKSINFERSRIDNSL